MSTSKSLKHSFDEADVHQMQNFSVGRICYAGRYAYQPAEESLMSEKPRHPLVEQMVNWKVLVYSYGYFGWLQMITCWAAFWVSPAADLIGVPLRTPVNNIEYFPPNFEGLVLGCIDADFCK